LLHVVDAYQALTKRRPVYFGGLGAIPVADIVSYAEAFEIPVRDLMRFCDALDIELFADLKTRQPRRN